MALLLFIIGYLIGHGEIKAARRELAFYRGFTPALLREMSKSRMRQSSNPGHGCHGCHG